MTVAAVVREMAEVCEVTADRADPAYVNATAFNRLEGVETDETLDLIGCLLTREVLTIEGAVHLSLAHKREINGLSEAPE